jgi:predicted TIM-barrel fold metal-dependent hydrolase
MIPTAFGPRRVFDAHTHFFGKSFYAGLAKAADLSGGVPDVARKLGWDEPPDDPADVARLWLAEMDRHGVDRMVCIHTLPGDVDEVGRGIRAAGGRLVGYAMVNPLDGGSPEALDRAVTEHGFRGVALFPAMHRFRVADGSAAAVLAVANRHGLNVFVHCGELKVAFRTKLGLPATFDPDFSNPLQLGRAANESPAARFIVPHLGSHFFRELLTLAGNCPNVYADTSGVPGWFKHTDAPDRPARARVFREAVDVIGAGRLLFGSDSTFFPRGWRRDVFDEQLRVFSEAKLTADEVGMILGGNLERLLFDKPGGSPP